MDDNPLTKKELKRERKLKKVAKRAAIGLGGGVALWLFQMLYPAHEGSEIIADIFRKISPMLILYGISVLGFILFKKKWALHVNMLMVWFIVPTYVLWLLMEAAGN